ncbi:MAG TPA: hypothetical protein VF177_12865 [Anaerolineae bacterium]
MVIDTSAIIAILSYEPEAEAFAEAIEDDPTRLSGEPLLFKGEDFSQTDIMPVATLQ